MATNVINLNVNSQTTVNLTSGTGAFASSGSPSVVVPGVSGGFAYTPGVSTAGGVNVVYGFSGTVVNGTPFTINLSTGVDQFGNTLGMVHVSRIHVINQDVIANTSHTMAVGAGTHPLMGSDQATLSPQGSALIDQANSAGYSVVGSSSDTITITAAAGTIPFSIIVFGRTA